ncbi:MAG: CoA-binding protein [Crocinitomicaceae bacterium]|nr:CoA-binding protein [Crocinitomicaceae bacterium]
MRTLVLGSSIKPERYSNMAIKLLREYDHDVIAHGLREGVVDDVPIQTSFDGMSGVDTITLYIGPQNQPPYYNEIINQNPRRVIFNPGTENPELQNLLKDNGIGFEEACTLVLLRTNQY